MLVLHLTHPVDSSQSPTHTPIEGSRLKQVASNISSSHTRTYLWHIKCIFHTVTKHLLHTITQSHSHKHSIGASVQFPNGPAVRVRLMASQTPPSAFILVHLSHRPLYGAQQGSETSERTAWLRPRTKNKHCSLLFVQIIVPADIAVNDAIMFGPRRLGFGLTGGSEAAAGPAYTLQRAQTSWPYNTSCPNTCNVSCDANTFSPFSLFRCISVCFV